MAQTHEVKPLPFAYDTLEGISEHVTRWHHDRIYTTYVERRNDIERQLQTVDRSTANPLHSEFAALKRHELRVANGMVLHQIYFEVLGGDGSSAHTRIHARIEDDFGSLASWREDFTACALSAECWAVLAWDGAVDRLRNLVLDHDSAAAGGALPLIVIDVAEHAYFYDHGPKRAAYVEAFIGNLNWKQIERRYVQVVPE